MTSASAVEDLSNAVKEIVIDVDEELKLLLSVGEECQTENELRELLLLHKQKSETTKFRLYDGFEPSGRMHIAQGVFKARNVNKCTRAGGVFVFWVADWFALMNDKMGGDLEKIQIVGQYLMEVWKAAGMILKHQEQDVVVFLWASEEITKYATKYWPQMIDIARRFNITRVKKCCQIMGRLEGGLTAAQILYPLMQCTDVFFLNANICQLGVDQRKVNMLAREYCGFVKQRTRPPIILSHHMLYGLKEGQAKMSKSDADSAIFMEDSSEEVRRKIMAAYCPTTAPPAGGLEKEPQDEQQEQDAGKSSLQLIKDELKNPCLDYVKNIILNDDPTAKTTFTAAGITYNKFEDVKDAFLTGKMSEVELKEGLINELNALLEPVRYHFTHNEHAKNLLSQVQQFKKEAATTTDGSSTEFRRLNLVSFKVIPANCAVVFVPFPTATPTLQLAMDTVAQIIQAASQQVLPIVLFLSDWSAMVQNACAAEEKVIQSFYDVFICCIKTLLLSSTTNAISMEKNLIIVRQSEAILKDPSNYWISVINVGRHFMLDEVMGEKMKDSDAVGRVIARLMRVADVLALNPAAVYFPAVINGNNDDAFVEKTLIEKYLSLPSVLKSFEKESAPILVDVFPFSPLVLQQARELEAHVTENDEYYLMDDPKVHGKSKMKKAFCQPGNVDFCPAISILTAFQYHLKFSVKNESENVNSSNCAITIQRSLENGGDIEYATPAELVADFSNGSMHPGDLKAAAATLMVSVLEQLSESIKNDPEVNKGAKALKAFEKKKQKSKK